jgi:cysteine-rich repeat protein
MTDLSMGPMAGCSSNCKIEPGFVCFGEPST